MKGKYASSLDSTKVCRSFEGWVCVVDHHITTRPDRDGGSQGHELSFAL